MAVEKGRQGHTFPPTIFLSIPLFLLRLVQSREFYDNYWTHHVKKISTAFKEALFHQSVQAVAYQGLCLLAEERCAKFKNRGYESQSELLLWFLFWRKLSGRIVYDFRLPVRFSHESLYGMSFLWVTVPWAEQARWKHLQKGQKMTPLYTWISFAKFS